LVEASRGLFVAFLGAEDQSQIEEGLIPAAFGAPGRGAVGRLRLLEPLLVVQGAAQVVVRLGEVGLQGDGLAEGRLRLLVPVQVVR